MLKSTHHFFGNNVKNLLITTAAACGAVCDRLDLLECAEYVIKLLFGMESYNDIVIAYLLTVTNNSVFHITYPLNMYGGEWELHPPANSTTAPPYILT